MNIHRLAQWTARWTLCVLVGIALHVHQHGHRLRRRQQVGHREQSDDGHRRHLQRRKRRWGSILPTNLNGSLTMFNNVSTSNNINSSGGSNTINQTFPKTTE